MFDLENKVLWLYPLISQVVLTLLLKYSCLKYIELSDKRTRVVQKNSTDCNTLGPITSGFNEAACDIFQGTWCPTPRNCAGLVNCIQDITDEVEKSANRQAFFTYLDDAPKVKTEEVCKCNLPI